MIWSLLLFLAFVTVAGVIMFFPHTRSLDGWDVGLTVALLSVAVVQVWVAAYSYYVTKKAREKGWRISVRGMLFGIFSISAFSRSLIIERQEFEATPAYDPGLSDHENLMRCITLLKAARKRAQRRERGKQRR